MSRYEWEKGSVVVPSKEWRGFKQAIRDAHDRQQALAHELASAVYVEITKRGRGKRGFDFQREAEAELSRRIEGPPYRGRWELYAAPRRYQTLATERERIMRSLFPRAEGRGRPVKPKLKDYPNAGRRESVFRAGEAGIALDDKSRTFRWNVPENNHACERAHEYAVASAAFAALAKVKWTRGTGGVITGNDEYNRESEGEGGGSNYVVFRFGPLGSERASITFPRQTARRRRA